MSAKDAARYNQYWDDVASGNHLPPGMTLDDWARYQLGLDKLDELTALSKIDADELISLRSSGNYTQTTVINSVENGSITLDSNMQKGNYGEMKMDVYYENQGYQRISNGRVTSLDDVTHKGIDGVYCDPGPPPKYIIGEAKYNTSNLSMTDDGLQMSDSWIKGSNRLVDAVGKSTADDILLNGYDSVLVKIKPNGDITTKILN